MSAEADRLAAAYLATGRLDGLPGMHFIEGAFVAGLAADRIDCDDPCRGRPFASVAAGDADDVSRAVAAANRAFARWRRSRPADRGALLMRLAALVRTHADRLAVVESLDVGKPLQQAEGDVSGVARCLEYYAGTADKLQGASLPLGDDHMGFTLFEPVGVTAHVVPWNYPLSTLARSLAPALAAGCTAVVKPAETASLTALMLAELTQEAGFPAGCVNVVTGTGAAAGAALVSHPDVRHVTFTGSVETGIGVMQAAARNVTSVLLELGGKSPAIVFADADLDRVVPDVLAAAFENSGQICSAATRLVVERSVRDELVERLARAAEALNIGHGLRRPDFAAVNSRRQLDKIAGHVDAARMRGLRIVTGGEGWVEPESGSGWYYRPTIVDDVPAGDPLAQEEVFGPVLAVQTADDEDHAVSLANATRFALVAGVYTRDFGRAHRLAREIDAGQVFVNEYFAGGIYAPFGGNRMSGIGREKGFDALRSYCHVKAVAGRIRE